MSHAHIMYTYMYNKIVYTRWANTNQMCSIFFIRKSKIDFSNEKFDFLF